jgi:Delta3-Delta2-enoyl-CoA isomerase
MYKPDSARLAAFWSAFQQVYLDLYGSRLACIAAVEGHAPAAGCMLSLACDYRIMSATDGKHRPTTGLNESQFGIVAPPWLAEMMASTIGHRDTEKALALGTLYSPEEALRIRLIDEVVPQEGVLAKAEQEAIKWAKIPPQARVASKMLMRQKKLLHLQVNRQEDIDSFVTFVTTDRVQEALGIYLDSLKKK